MAWADWTAPIDAYCERTDPSLWSEPVNAISNFAFLIAAGLAWRSWRRGGATDLPALILIALTAAVGIGSFLFHTFANRWSVMADVLPIAAFIYTYFFIAMRRFLSLGLPAALGVTLAFATFNVGFTSLWRMAFGPEAVAATNGSLGYVPAALALLAVGMTLRWRTAADRAAPGKTGSSH